MRRHAFVSLLLASLSLAVNEADIRAAMLSAVGLIELDQNLEILNGPIVVPAGKAVTISSPSGAEPFILDLKHSNSRAFTIKKTGSLTLRNVQIINGLSTNVGELTQKHPFSNYDATDSVTYFDNAGGLIFNAGTLSLTDVQLTNGTARSGGCLYNVGTVSTILRATFSDCDAIITNPSLQETGQDPDQGDQQEVFMSTDYMVYEPMGSPRFPLRCGGAIAQHHVFNDASFEPIIVSMSNSTLKQNSARACGGGMAVMAGSVSSMSEVWFHQNQVFGQYLEAPSSIYGVNGVGPVPTAAVGAHMYVQRELPLATSFQYTIGSIVDSWFSEGSLLSGTENTGALYGGAIFVHSVNDHTFTELSGFEYEFPILGYNKTRTFSQSDVFNNPIIGGIRGSTFKNNVVTVGTTGMGRYSGGGAIATTGKINLIVDSVFDSNGHKCTDGAISFGGHVAVVGDIAMYGVLVGEGQLNQGVVGSIVRCEFKNGYAVNGGAIDIAHGEVESIEECVFTENKATEECDTDFEATFGGFSVNQYGFGGAIRLGNSLSNLDIPPGPIFDKAKELYAPFVNDRFPTIEFRNNVFDKNSAHQGGGAISMLDRGGVSSFGGWNVFKNNFIETTTGYAAPAATGGGALGVQNSIADFLCESLLFRSNNGTTGGALYVGPTGTVSITSQEETMSTTRLASHLDGTQFNQPNVFYANSASDRGGAVFVDLGADFSTSRVAFQANAAHANCREIRTCKSATDLGLGCGAEKNIFNEGGCLDGVGGAVYTSVLSTIGPHVEFKHNRVPGVHAYDRSCLPDTCSSPSAVSINAAYNGAGLDVYAAGKVKVLGGSFEKLPYYEHFKSVGPPFRVFSCFDSRNNACGANAQCTPINEDPQYGSDSATCACSSTTASENAEEAYTTGCTPQPFISTPTLVQQAGSPTVGVRWVWDNSSAQGVVDHFLVYSAPSASDPKQLLKLVMYDDKVDDPSLNLVVPAGYPGTGRFGDSYYQVFAIEELKPSVFFVQAVSNGLTGQYSAASEVAIICPDGHRQVVETSQAFCSPCAPGTFVIGLNACADCPQDLPATKGEVGGNSKSDCTSAVGQFSRKRDIGSNKIKTEALPCPDGALCVEAGVEIETIPIKSGFWRSTAETIFLRECINPTYCWGGDGYNRWRWVNDEFGVYPTLFLDFLELFEPPEEFGFAKPEIESQVPTSAPTFSPTSQPSTAPSMSPTVFFPFRRRADDLDEYTHDSQIPRDTTHYLDRATNRIVFPKTPSGFVYQVYYDYWVSDSRRRNDEVHRRFLAVESEFKLTNTSYCAPHHVGPLCETCEEGYGIENPGEGCKKCSNSGEDTNRIILQLSLLALIAIILSLAFIMYQSRQMKKRRDKDKHDSKTLEALTNELQNYFLIFTTFMGKVKILLGLMQILSSYATTFRDNFDETILAVLDRLSVLQFDVTSFLSLGCSVRIDHYSRMLVYTLTPVGIMLFFGLMVWVVSKFFRGNVLLDQIVKDIRGSGISALLALGFLVYPSVSQAILETFSCVTYEDGSRFLAADVTVSCDDDPLRTFWLIYAAVCVLIYPVGIVVLYLSILIQWRVELNPEGYGESREKDMAIIKKRDENPKIAHIKFLWSNYEPPFFYFEAYELVRKLFQTSVVIFLLPGSITQIILTQLVSFVSLMILSATAPYIEDEDDTLAVGAMWTLILSLTYLLANKIDVAEQDEFSGGVLDVVMWLTLLTCPVLFVYQMLDLLFGIHRRLKARIVGVCGRELPDEGEDYTRKAGRRRSTIAGGNKSGLGILQPSVAPAAE